MAAGLALFVLLRGIGAWASGGPAGTAVQGGDPPPRILSVAVSPLSFGAGDWVHGRVQTSSNVASVEARVGAFSTTLQRGRPGDFTLAYRVPWVPFFLHGTYDLAIIARNAGGSAVSRTIKISLR